VLPLLRVCTRLLAAGPGVPEAISNDFEASADLNPAGDWRQPLSQPLLDSVADAGLHSDVMASADGVSDAH